MASEIKPVGVVIHGPTHAEFWPSVEEGRAMGAPDGPTTLVYSHETVETLRTELRDERIAFDEIENAHAETLAEVARLREALKAYADNLGHSRWCQQVQGSEHEGWLDQTKVCDCGHDRARRALQEAEE